MDSSFTPPTREEILEQTTRSSGSSPGFFSNLGKAISGTIINNPYYSPVMGGPAGPAAPLSSNEFFMARPSTPPLPPLAKSNIGGVSPSEEEMTPPPPGMSFEEYLASMGIGGSGGGASRPDFSAYRAALTEQAGGLNAQIQAMYNALAEEAGANVGRIQDIYGGAGQGIGSVYDSAAGNVADAYGSAQQQAADQMARLGIEAAAPAVINPMALSQAQAVSGLEQGRASGQAAAERYGASAGGFGSQMAQVAQQQGTEMNAAILASLQNRLAESLAAEQTGGGGGGGGGMSVSDMLKLREAYGQDVLGELPLEERKFAAERADAIIRNSRSDEEAFNALVLPNPDTGKPLMTPDEAEAALRYSRETFAPNFGPSF
jgi:hypothetical protein